MASRTRSNQKEFRWTALAAAVGCASVLFGTPTDTPAQDVCGDVNGDGGVTITDALSVLRSAVGHADPLVCEFESLTTDSGLEIVRLSAPDEAVAGIRIAVDYTGWLYDPASPGGRGFRFDSSLDREEPFIFRLGVGQVIAGWDEGVAGMRVGEIRELRIPPELAYDTQGVPDLIPPDATLLFEVYLLAVE